MDNRKMRITVDIDAETLDAIQKETGLKKSPAIRKIAADYVMGLQRKRFLRKVLEGRTDYGMTNEQLEGLGSYDVD